MACRHNLMWQLLCLALLISVSSANLRELRQLLKRGYVDDGREGDDEDYRRASGSGSGSEPTPEVEVCGPDTDLERFCGGPCGRAHCQDYPEAECRVNSCEACEAEWYLYGRKLTQHDCTNRPLTCPGVWIPKGDHCYRVQNRYGLTHKNAQKYCMRQGGHLVGIDSSTEQSAIQTLPLVSDKKYWTAGAKSSSRSWYWQLPDENKPMTYTKWAPGEPNNSGFQGFPENRAGFITHGGYWRWNDVDQYQKFQPICEAAPEKVLSHCESKPCMNGGECVMVAGDTYRCDCGNAYKGTYCELSNDNSKWHRFEGHMYLIVSDFGLTRPDATTYCGVHDAYLVSFNTKTEWEFIKGLLDKKGLSNPTNGFSTGGYKTPTVSRSAVAWADGTTLGSFKDWGRGEPNQSNEPYIRMQFYTESNPSQHGWRWNDVPGDWVSSFICEKAMYAAQRRQLNHKGGMLKRLFSHRWHHVDATRQY